MVGKTKNLDEFKFKLEYIWNCDETMVDLSKRREKVVCCKGDAVPTTALWVMQCQLQLYGG